MAPSILVGTRKGLFVLRGDDDRREWSVEEPMLSGWEVFHATEHDGTLFAAANNFVYGATVQRSTDGGRRGSAAKASACLRRRASRSRRRGTSSPVTAIPSGSAPRRARSSARTI